MGVLVTNETVKQLFHIAQSIARENYNATYSGPHILQALMHKDIGLNEFLKSIDKDPGYFYEWADVRIEDYPKTTHLPAEVGEGEFVDQILEEADDIRLKLGLDEITPICILTAIVKPQVAFTLQQLKSLPLREHEIFSLYIKDTPFSATQDGEISSLFGGNSSDFSDSSFPSIKAYCVDRTAQAKNGDLENIIGRDKELRMLVEILCRRSKHNVIIIGEPGVGKTALVEGFANEIIKENVPEMLKNATLLELDTRALLAGTSYKGEIEDRLKKVINECKKIDHVFSKYLPTETVNYVKKYLNACYATGEFSSVLENYSDSVTMSLLKARDRFTLGIALSETEINAGFNLNVIAQELQININDLLSWNPEIISTLEADGESKLFLPTDLMHDFLMRKNSILSKSIRIK